MYINHADEQRSSVLLPDQAFMRPLPLQVKAQRMQLTQAAHLQAK
jgi:hypothetical protein